MVFPSATPLLALILGAAVGKDTWGWVDESSQISGTSPEARYAQAMALDPTTNYAIIFGGRRAGWSDFDNDTHVLDLRDRKWLVLPAHAQSGPGDRFDVGEFSWGDSFYVFGGSTYYYEGSVEKQQTYNELWAFNFTNYTWSKISTTGAPAKRYGHVMEIIGSKAYLFGGRTDCLKNNVTCPTNKYIDVDFYYDTWVLDLTTMKWSQFSTITQPSSRINMGSFVLDGKFYILGGRLLGGSASTRTTYNDLWVFNPTTGTWSEVSPASSSATLPARYSPASVAFNGSFYVFGGGQWLTNSGTLTRKWLNDSWVFNPTTKVWKNLNPLLAPSPREMAQGIVSDGMWMFFGGAWGYTKTEQVDYSQLWALDLENIHKYSASGSKAPLAMLLLLAIAHLVENF